MRSNRSLYAWLGLIVLSVLGMCFTTGAPSARSYKQLSLPPLGLVRLPEPHRFELMNGLVVYLLEEHEFPKIGLLAMIRVGSRWEPMRKAGLAKIAGAVMSSSSHFGSSWLPVGRAM